jgi:3-hydroxyacyl-CoA dehydrogenase
MKKTPNADPLPFVQNVMQTIGTAKVSSSAADAKTLGYLSESDRIVMNRDHLLYEAKQEVLEMHAAGYTAPANGDTCYAAGRDVRAAVKAGIYVLQQGGYISEYDAYISGRLAYVICGGDLSSGEWVSEQYMLDLERDVFVEVAHQTKTIERIQFTMKTGKPLRN